MGLGAAVLILVVTTSVGHLQRPFGWSGRIWARTGCDFDPSGNGTCNTGRCGTSLKCTASGETPASLAEFTLASPDFYDVSLVDGFNLPLVIRPVNGRGNCSTAGCDGDLLRDCPSELQVLAGGAVVGCRSACEVFEPTSSAAGEFTATRSPASRRPTRGNLRRPAPQPTATPTTTHPASSLAPAPITSQQTVCTYHDNELICSGSERSRLLPSLAWAAAALFFFAASW
ncbi:unnamed protein product [Spirodela intermedia]|uniref:Uncharacterized protein n=1 Tax=Spirodela intermedia TaxID=51605 RepID=A0A7I8J0P2_SPIIN|nr:unnamed protein product [Spirodela intermedia]CAA6663804.1 unnamed protein product [Spirodela intermedia]